MEDVLSNIQLKRLSEHKYSAEGQSILEPPLQKFWRWLVEQVPMWWAPNAITLAGLALNVITTLTLMLYSPDFKQEVPGWAFMLVAAGLFVYQSLDAIDGKQARRTRSATPLGELFDHGCDSVSTVFVCIGSCIALGIGTDPVWLFFEAFSTMFVFYAAHWQAYCSGILRFGRFDVTEGQFLVIAVYIMSGVLGSGFWEYTVPLLGTQLKWIPVYLSIIGVVLAAQSYFTVILRGGVGKNGSTVAGTSVLSPLFPIGILIVGATMIWQKSPSHLFENHPVLYIVSFGTAAAKVTNKLVVAHMSRSEMDILDTCMIGPGLLFLNQYLDCILDEYIVLWACLGVCTFDLLHYSVRVCNQICNYLNIHCFKITDAATPKTNSSSANNGSHAGGEKLRSRPITRSVTKQVPPN